MRAGVHKVFAQVCPASFLTELDFWRISHQHVGSCCADIVPQKREEEKEEEKVGQKRMNSYLHTSFIQMMTGSQCFKNHFIM